MGRPWAAVSALTAGEACSSSPPVILTVWVLACLKLAQKSASFWPLRQYLHRLNSHDAKGIKTVQGVRARSKKKIHGRIQPLCTTYVSLPICPWQLHWSAAMLRAWIGEHH